MYFNGPDLYPVHVIMCEPARKSTAASDHSSSLRYDREVYSVKFSEIKYQRPDKEEVIKDRKSIV